MSKKYLVAIMVVLFAVVALGASEAAEQKGLRLAMENESANNGFDGEAAETEMTLVNAQGDKTVRKMTSRTKEAAKDGDMSVITFLWPADVKGTRMLTRSHKKKDDDQWLYLPSLKRVKRISSRNKSGAFMGSEFAYEDLGSQEVEKYSHKWLRDENLDGRDCWVMERIPVSKKSGYSKQVSWVDKEYRQPLKMEYFDRKGELLKIAAFVKYKKLKNWWRVHEIKMNNVQTRKSSVIKWSMRELKEGYNKDDFDSEALSEES
ncbi:MAG: outer membrane lipoprotein-sorting protein [bacterium]|nr:outer membrane lipoprotein-sorting protein [bacterium]